MRFYRYLSCIVLAVPLICMAEPVEQGELVEVSEIRAAPVFAETDSQALGENMASDEARISYLIGYRLGQNLSKQDIDDLDYESLWQGLLEAEGGIPSRYTEAQFAQAYSRYFEWKQLQQKHLETENHDAAQQFLQANGQSELIATTGSGLQYQVMEVGSGSPVILTDWVRIRYQARLTDGVVVSDSHATPEGVWVPVASVIPAWTEALQLMQLGARWVVYAGPELTFGSAPALEGVPVNAVLVFELELLEVRAEEVDDT